MMVFVGEDDVQNGIETSGIIPTQPLTEHIVNAQWNYHFSILSPDPVFVVL